MPEVFISYAHADDQVLAEGTKGWVSALAERLQKALAMKPGGSQVKVWMDHRLEPQRVVDAALAERVGRAACFVAVLSPRYLESAWCRDEIERFLGRVGKDAGRLFLLELTPTERAAWPAAARELSTLPFWAQSFDDPAPMPLGWPAPDPAGDRPYWRALNELAHFMSGPLQSAGTAAGNSGAPKRRIWLADPTDHVLDAWERLAAALRQQGCEVLPGAPGQYPSSVEVDWRHALTADLRSADLCVQLLGPHPGRRPPWSGTPFSLLQAQAVEAAVADRGVPSCIWRVPEVPLASVSDAAYAGLLTGATACGLEDFQQQVLARVASLNVAPVPPSAPTPAANTPPQPVADTAPSLQPPAAPGSPVAFDGPVNICVNADGPDRHLGEQVRDLLFELGVDASLAPLPTPEQSPAQWRQDYEAQLTESQGLVIVYGASPASWVQAQVQAARKLLARTRRGTWGALLDGPPGQQPDHGVRSHSLVMLNCRAGLTRESLTAFLAGLRKDAAAGGSASTGD